MIRFGILLMSLLASFAIAADDFGQNERTQFANQIMNEIQVVDIYARLTGPGTKEFASFAPKLALQAAVKPEDQARLTSALEPALVKSAHYLFVDKPAVMAEAILATSPELKDRKDYLRLKSLVENTATKKMFATILVSDSKTSEQRQAELKASFTPKEAADWAAINASPEHQRVFDVLMQAIGNGLNLGQGNGQEDKKAAQARNARSILCGALKDVEADGYSVAPAALNYYCAAS